jgi:cytidine deaminase
MAALLDGARRGVGVGKQRLFCTTFPCHNCARHIIAAGIAEVVFREPYEKSLAAELHDDALVVDPATDADGKVVFRRFVGIGPPRYQDLFTMQTRKDAQGNKIDWSKGEAVPRLVSSSTAYLNVEEEFLDDFKEALALDPVDLGEGVEDGAT